MDSGKYLFEQLLTVAHEYTVAETDKLRDKLGEKYLSKKKNEEKEEKEEKER